MIKPFELLDKIIARQFGLEIKASNGEESDYDIDYISLFAPLKQIQKNVKSALVDIKTAADEYGCWEEDIDEDTLHIARESCDFYCELQYNKSKEAMFHVVCGYPTYIYRPLDKKVQEVLEGVEDLTTELIAGACDDGYKKAALWSFYKGNDLYKNELADIERDIEYELNNYKL